MLLTKKRKFYLKHIKNLHGDSLRMSIFFSKRHLYMQLINDKLQHTLLTLSTLKQKKNNRINRHLAYTFGKNVLFLLYKNRITNHICIDMGKKSKYVGKTKTFIDTLFAVA